MPKSSSSISKIQRKILFGKIHCGLQPSGKEVEFESLGILQAIPKEATARYTEIDGNVSLGSAVIRKQAPSHFCLWNRRMRGLPQVERAGNFNEIPLADEEGLAEKTHIIFFPNNIVGYEYNHHGPRVSRLDGYFHELAPGTVPRFRVETLIHPDIAARFEKLGDLFSVDLKMSRQYAEILKSEGDALGSALAAAAKVGNFEKITLSGSVNRKKEETIPEATKKFFRKLMKNPNPGLELFKVKGENSSCWLDILKDQISIDADVEIEQTKTSRCVNSAVMFKRIEEAYSSLQDKLEDAVMVG